MTPSQLAFHEAHKAARRRMDQAAERFMARAQGQEVPVVAPAEPIAPPAPVTTPQAWVRRQKEIWFKILSDRPVARHAVTIADIQHVVAQRFDVTRADLISARRTAKLVHPRMIAFYLAKKITPHSLPKIGRAFGGRDHSTALHSIRTIERRLKDDQALRELVSGLEAQLGGPYEPTDSDQ